MNRSCVDQIAALRIIVIQSEELTTLPSGHFIDYDKSFDSVRREQQYADETLWNPREIAEVEPFSTLAASLRVRVELRQGNDWKG